MMNKEQIYDEQINPLMRRIIEICAEHRIPHACQFALDHPGFMCSTFNAYGDDHIQAVAKLMWRGNHEQMLAVTIAGGERS